MKIKKINVNDNIYPKRLLRTKNFPVDIYAIGNIDLLNAETSVGIVGSRNCTEYGRNVANDFAKKLAQNGICIISGLAVGIDGVAHNAAIEQVGKTVAVLGGGFEHIYPTENTWLFHKILDNGGCIISEYEPEVKPDKSKFPVRNRIISGLSDAVLIIEANYRSGSTITAKYAKKEGKPIYAIPNSIYASTSIGTNRLIQEGAILATSPLQILQDLKGKVSENKVKLTNTNKKINKQNLVYLDDQKENLINVLSDEYLKVYKTLSDEPMHINEIARKAGKSISDISYILTMLEIEGYAIQTQANFFAKDI